MEEILFIAAFILLFGLIGWFLNYISEGDFLYLFKLSKKIYIVLLPLSFFVWLFKSIILKSWFNDYNLIDISFTSNVMTVIFLLMSWVGFNKLCRKHSSIRRKYRIVEYCSSSEYPYAIQRIIIIFNFSIIIIPLLNLYSIVTFIKSYFLYVL